MNHESFDPFDHLWIQSEMNPEAFAVSDENLERRRREKEKERIITSWTHYGER